MDDRDSARIIIQASESQYQKKATQLKQEEKPLFYFPDIVHVDESSSGMGPHL